LVAVICRTLQQLNLHIMAYSNVHITSLPGGSLEAPRWDSVLDAEASAEGSTGVTFVLTGEGSYVIKAGSRPAEEYFASLVFGELGIPAPRVRCVGHTSKEWSDIKVAIRIGARLRESRGDKSGALRVQRSDRPQLLVMEVVSCSAPLEGHAGAAALLKIGGDDAEARLTTMGRVLAVDVFLNNSDRIVAPCWDNDGNGGNLLLCCGADATAGLVPIDSVITAIAPSAPNAYFAKYQERVKAFLDSVCSGATRPGSAWLTYGSSFKTTRGQS
jgi:hypothetical protein